MQERFFFIVLFKDELIPEWNGNLLRVTQRIPSFKKHSITGETVWANHSDVFHTSQAKGEYSYIAKKTGKIFDYFLWVFLIVLTWLRVILIAPENQAMNSTFGDHTVIQDIEQEQVRKTIWKNMVIYQWKQGDIIILDNQRVSHGRLPFTGNDRKIICAWGDSPIQ